MRKRFSVFLVDMIAQTFPVPKMRHEHRDMNIDTSQGTLITHAESGSAVSLFFLT